MPPFSVVEEICLPSIESRSKYFFRKFSAIIKSKIVIMQEYHLFMKTSNMLLYIGSNNQNHDLIDKPSVLYRRNPCVGQEPD